MIVICFFQNYTIINWKALFSFYVTGLLFSTLPKNLIKQLDCGFDKVPPETCAKIIKTVREIEDEFWATAIKMDAQ